MLRAVASVVGAVLLLSGCSGSGGHAATLPPLPTTAPSTPPATSTSTATPTASPSPARTGPLTTGPGVRPGEQPPVEGPVATQHTETGALAFAGYFIHALDWSIATNDTYLIKQLSAPSCQACNNYVHTLQGLHAKGASQAGGRLTVKSARIVQGSFTVKADYAIEFELSESGAVINYPASSPSAIPANNSITSIVFVSWVNGRYVVEGQGAPS